MEPRGGSGPLRRRHVAPEHRPTAATQAIVSAEQAEPRSRTITTAEHPSLQLDTAHRQVRCTGEWTAPRLAPVEHQLERLPESSEHWQLDASGISRMDTAGALLLRTLLDRLSRRGSIDAQLRDEQRDLLELIARVAPEAPRAPAKSLGLVGQLGRGVVTGLVHGRELLSFVGESAADSLPRLLRPHRLRWKQIIAEVERAGLDALPIVGLLVFLMGVVIAYQGGGPLEDYGANIYLVDLLAITMLREMAPLVTAIVVAGRTGSAYAAQLGTMKITDEVDALRTLGITPTEMLVLPKLLALVVALPLLTVFADLMGVVGGMLVAQSLFDIGFIEFIERLPLALQNSSYWVGIVKAPVFAVIIATVGCFNGLQVEGSAEQVGSSTTRSVVQAIFLVIVIDAVFSIAFNWMGL